MLAHNHLTLGGLYLGTLITKAKSISVIRQLSLSK